MPSRLASVALLMVALKAPAFAQFAPKPAPTTPVETSTLASPGDPYPGALWTLAPPAPDVNAGRLLVAANEAMAGDPVGTRAIVVIHRGTLVLERYAEGYGPASRFAGWSLGKALINAGIGILARDGRLSLLSPNGLAAWQGEKDPRHDISVRDLITMTSGVAWRASKPDPEAQLMFGTGRIDAAGWSMRRKPVDDVGRTFRYTSGDSALLGAIVARTVARNANTPAVRRQAVRDFYRNELFGPLGIKSAIIEFDRSGAFTGNFVHMSAQDYARLGYLYLRDGRWELEKIFPERWVEFTATPSAATNSAAYGAHFWLMTRRPNDESPPPTIEDDPRALLATGMYGQAILIVPSRSLVVVRLGHSPASAWPQIHAFLREVAACFPQN